MSSMSAFRTRAWESDAMGGGGFLGGVRGCVGGRCWEGEGEKEEGGRWRERDGGDGGEGSEGRGGVKFEKSSGMAGDVADLAAQPPRYLHRHGSCTGGLNSLHLDISTSTSISTTSISTTSSPPPHFPSHIIYPQHTYHGRPARPARPVRSVPRHLPPPTHHHRLHHQRHHKPLPRPPPLTRTRSPQQPPPLPQTAPYH